ncbi:MAG: Gfo/Idh/MocA family oxidoreductase [Planctomycetes bacterium]|nr:Gfo/Idh/MocA family oxidoreductase [Planctomycetota bacterium]
MSISRRRLLQTGAAATALSAIKPVASLRAADAPSRKVTVGVMGNGGRGTELAKQFAKQAGVEVAYVCDPDRQRVENCASEVNKVSGKAPQAVANYKQILDDKRVDAVVIATPDHWHGPGAIWACQAGKHVYVEKPACHNPAEGEMMVAAADKYKRHVQLGTQRRSMEGMREAIELIRGGEIGRVLVARCQYFSPRGPIGPRKQGPVPEGFDYSLWQGPAPELPYEDFPEVAAQKFPASAPQFHYQWHWFWHWGTAEVGNNGVHMIDLCRWGLGVDYPSLVSCIGGRYRYHDSQETPDTSVVEIQCGDQMIVWEQRSWTRTLPGDQTYEVAFYGEKGSLFYNAGKYTIVDPAGKTVKEGKGSSSGTTHIENFLAAVREDAPLNQPITEGVKSTLMCHLANISYRTGRAITLDPKTHRIANDPDAMKLWNREYRAGWEVKV